MPATSTAAARSSLNVVSIVDPLVSHLHFITSEKWQARRDSNPQPAVLETAALPVELLA